MSSQVRRDRRERPRFGPQGYRQTWVPRGASTSVVVNEPLISSNLDRDSASIDANSAPLPVNQPRRHTDAGLLLNNHARGRGNSALGPPPANRQRRNNGSGQGHPPYNRQRGVSRGHFARHTRQEIATERSENKEAGLKDPDLPQLVQEIQDKLMKGAVECMICYDMVRRSANIWSCTSCYSIFHLNCIKRWVRAPTSVDLAVEKNHGFNWRCPGCQSVQLTSSKEICYRCFCGKRKDPPSDPYLTPHSCGEPCGKPLEKEFAGAETSEKDRCPHVCVLQCHPGPCPPCKAFAPPRHCPCGKKMITTRCSERSSVSTCGQCCNKLLGCGRHRCERTCHVGPCDPCQLLVNANCFCKKKSDVVICGDMNIKGEVKVEYGLFSCSSTCGRLLGCGNHSCREVCHPGPCGDCDLLPNRIKTCYCGKTTLEEQRRSCLDPIPSCSYICRKVLPCGLHSCNEVCHAGDCPPCLIQVNQKCRCGSASRIVECYKTTAEAENFVCEKPCGRKKNCGRHRCSDRCCLLSNPKNDPTHLDWDPHFCQIPCGKKLRCGQHSCESLCHSGHCPSCLETIFTDLTCACGKTSIPPPLPCGTSPPSCQLLCSVLQPCGHAASHACHFGDCPPCSVPVEKKCIGGHVVLRNIPCGLKDIRCTKLCGKTRRCGMHACARTCHPEPCDVGVETETCVPISCGQTCGAPRRDCRLHTCAALCHPSDPCPDLRCEFPVTITCSCGRISAAIPCDAGGTVGGFGVDSLYEASVLKNLPVPLQPVESTGNRIPLGQRKLTCDDDCAKLEWKRVLQDAFDITPPNLDALHFGENHAMKEIISDMRDPKWVLAVEERCKFLVLGKSRGSANASALKLHVFCPLQKDKRDAIRLIARRWKLAVSNAGWEPRRFTVVHVTPKSKPPSRIIGGKGSVTVSALHPPAFDPMVDMDPRLVVSFMDLPRDASISTLVLRFGGECELVWLNDKNAIAVFHDPARAATAMRRLDHGSVYQGAVMVVVQNVGQTSQARNPWGGKPDGGTAMEGRRGNPWKKAVIHDDDSWGADDDSPVASSTDIQVKADARTAVSVNRWSVLGSEKAMSTASVSANETSMVGNDAGNLQGVGSGEEEDVVDDWEKGL
ncbi:PREDICTED: NF-X1-type zinc finger protein NFXL1-like [Tarenaya hassleriana]|uniref:NF-X1-type zinc finger protein NFXL1-like n=1 Tax=Tarenaya hassleriana TaxID=28532 RepID=UPI0008FD7745|nr:PREDICTED: NF-X1-type zinc finger protein NFXL1-like [Tarenaya hassleriana]